MYSHTHVNTHAYTHHTQKIKNALTWYPTNMLPTFYCHFHLLSNYLHCNNVEPFFFREKYISKKSVMVYYRDWEYQASEGYTPSPTSKTKQNKPKTEGNVGAAWSHQEHLKCPVLNWWEHRRTVQDWPTRWVFRLDALDVACGCVPKNNIDGVQGISEVTSRHISFSGFEAAFCVFS